MRTPDSRANGCHTDVILLSTLFVDNSGDKAKTIDFALSNVAGFIEVAYFLGKRQTAFYPIGYTQLTSGLHRVPLPRRAAPRFVGTLWINHKVRQKSSSAADP